MKKIVKSLIFPAISVLIVAIIYGGLSIVNLNNQTKTLQKQNQVFTFNASNLQDELNQIQVRVEQTISLNSSLQQSLVAAQKQIAYLQTKANIKASSSVVAEPAVITKTITQTVTQEVEKNQAQVIVDRAGKYSVDLQAGDAAFDVLKRASEQNNFALDYSTDPTYGAFINGINGIMPYNKYYWFFYYNGNSSKVGVSSQPISKGDVIEFRYELSTW